MDNPPEELYIKDVQKYYESEQGYKNGLNKISKEAKFYKNKYYQLN